MSDLPPLAYCRPDSLASVLEALERRGACLYAGGTDLLVALSQRREWVRSVRELVDIKNLVEAQGITDLGPVLRIGSLTTAAQLAASRPVRRYARALAEAAEETSAPLLRARGTVGGNLATPHPAGDVTTALLALNATVELAAPRSALRLASVEHLLRHFSAHRAARPIGKKLIVAIHVPKCRQSAFEKFGTRRAFSRSVIAVAVAIHAQGTSVAIGGIGERPFLATNLSTDVDARAALTRALGADARSANDPDYLTSRLLLAEALIARAHARACRR